MNSVKYWVWLSMVFGTGSHRIWELMHLFESAEYVYKEIKAGYLSNRLDEKELHSANNITIEQAEEHIKYCESIGICVIGCGDIEYPQKLRNIYNPPAVLYCKGNVSCMSSETTVVAVGTRRASDYSLRAADRICRELSLNGVVIVSGFAVGIDIASHLAAASVNRPTICVMGCGLDVDYPKDNFRYRDRILAAGGLFVSEYPPGIPPYSQNFPKRNRILSALGKATIVFEASNRSGSLITAGLAAEQGREVFCLPPANIFSMAYSGNVSLLRDGANPMYSAKDVMEYFCIGIKTDEEPNNNTYPNNSARKNAVGAAAFEKDVLKNVKLRKNEFSVITEVKKSDAKSLDPELYKSLSAIQKKIVDIMSAGAVHADTIVQRTGNDSVEIISELTELELLGVIRSLPGKMFEIAEFTSK